MVPCRVFKGLQKAAAPIYRNTDSCTYSSLTEKHCFIGVHRSSCNDKKKL